MALLTFTPSPFKGNPPISSALSLCEVKLAPVTLIRGNNILVFAKIKKNGGVKNTKIPFNITKILTDKQYLRIKVSLNLISVKLRTNFVFYYSMEIDSENFLKISLIQQRYSKTF